MKFKLNIKKIMALWEMLIGDPKSQPLEARIFHAVCILSALTLAISIPINLLIGLNQLAFIMLCVCIMVSISYYYSRFKNKSQINITFYAILSNLLFTVNFYFNSGIDGPTMILFIASLFLIIAIVPPKQYYIWISLNIIIVALLLATQYLYPDLVRSTYSSSSNRYLDLFISYFLIVVVIFAITKYIRNSYSTEKRAVEQKALELEASNDTKNKLLSIFAHDLRAPLDILQGYLEILPDANLTPEEKQVIEADLLKKTQNTGQMLANLLSWTRAQMNGVQVNLQTVNLTQSLKQTIQIQEEISRKKGIHLRNDIDSHTNIIADADMLQIIIRNLLNNAIKFTSSGGEIVLANKQSNKNVIIIVEDNGIGIPQSQQAGLFSLKGKSTYGTKKEKGVGLGLVLCKEFAELQNASIWCESVQSIGTTFYVSFPKA